MYDLSLEISIWEQILKHTKQQLKHIHWDINNNLHHNSAALSCWHSNIPETFLVLAGFLNPEGY